MAVSTLRISLSSPRADMEADDVRLLAAVGFMAARSGLGELAKRIFQGLSVIRPEADFPRIGMVMAHLCTGDGEKALQYIAECGSQCLAMSPEFEVIATVIDDSAYSAAAHPIAERIIAILGSPESRPSHAIP